jgi:dienelactone hydrolase
MRQDIEFDAEGVTLRGWLYLPDGAGGPVPTVVMAHGFSAVKEMFLDSFAEAFAAGGLGAVVFDNRNFGASDGEPRQEIDPWAQVRDYRHAITWAQTRSEVDPDRIGVWGSSYSGGHVLVLGAIDKRIKCVACQVPLVAEAPAAAMTSATACASSTVELRRSPPVTATRNFLASMTLRSS